MIRLFGLVNDVTPRKPDVMQVAFGPLRQFAPAALTIAPSVEDFTELREKALAMMICHRYI
jgi:hypothetical protein